MLIDFFVFPMRDLDEIEKALLELTLMVRDGKSFAPEVKDWMDWAERVLDDEKV